MYGLLKHREPIVFLVRFVERIYIANVTKPSKSNEKTLNEYSMHNLNLTGFLFILYAICAVVFVCVPILVLLIFHVNEPTLPIFVPFVDYHTRTGGFITTTYHYLFIFTAINGMGFCDSLFSNLIFSLIQMSELISNDLTFIGQKLKNPVQNVQSIRVQLKNTYLMYSEVQRSAKLFNLHKFKYPKSFPF